MLFKRLKQFRGITNHDEFLASSEIIKDSHNRCRQRMVNTYLIEIPKVLENLQIEKLLKNSSFLLKVAWPYVKKDLYRNFT